MGEDNERGCGATGRHGRHFLDENPSASSIVGSSLGRGASLAPATLVGEPCFANRLFLRAG